MKTKKNSASQSSLPISPNMWKEAFRRFCKNPIAIISLVIFCLIVLACLCAPLITDQDYSSLNMDALYSGVSKEHPFGTDMLGRDMLARVLYGGRNTLRMSFTALILSAIFGAAVGLVSGFYGGSLDIFLMRVMDTVSAIPTLILAIVAEVTFGFGVGNYMYAIAMALMPPIARVLRASVMTVVNSEYMEAARALGVSNGTIIIRHVMPNVIAPLLVHVSNAASEAILTCTIISYIGLGLFPPAPEWGELVNYGYNALRTYPHVALIPCFAVSITVLALSFIGNGLRDAFDTNMKNI